jgi:type IV secretory pathway VirD2 relaxase
MASNNGDDSERDFRLRPRKPRAARSGATAGAFVALLYHAKAARRSARSAKAKVTRRPHQQRCAIRVMYSKNTTAGQWRAHGRYLARDSAASEGNIRHMGFDGDSENVDIQSRLNTWQDAGDERLWKFIVSPEFGDRIDMEKLTRDLMARIEKDLGVSTEWVAITHHNTDHRHTHVALRGVDGNGRPILFDRQFIQHGIREIAQELCTRQLGYRTPADALVAQEREVHQHRFTSLDRMIEKTSQQKPDDPTRLVANANGPAAKSDSGPRSQTLIAQRLRALEQMGLAEASPEGGWYVKSDFGKVLRAMQKAADRQKTLTAHGVVLSDANLPFVSFDIRRSKFCEGRVLVHGEEEESGRRYFMVEGTDGKVHHVYSNFQADELRRRGGIRPNSFVQLRRVDLDGEQAMDVQDFGNAESLLGNAAHFDEAAKRLGGRRRSASAQRYSGWLGRYRDALDEATERMGKHRPQQSQHQRLRRSEPAR